jgi:hypothetical protein
MENRIALKNTKDQFKITAIPVTGLKWFRITNAPNQNSEKKQAPSLKERLQVIFSMFNVQ